VTVKIERRTFLQRALTIGALATGVAKATPLQAVAKAAPLHGRAAAVQTRRFTLSHGVAVGAIGNGRALVWSRSDRPSRLVIDYATTEKFNDAMTVGGTAALESSDFTARVVLTDLQPGQRIFYRARFQDLSDLRTWSEPEIGSFVTAPTAATRDVTIAWSADTAGQGWGINPDFGYRLYDAMLAVEPDVFIHCGDTIYADAPLAERVTLDDGTIWRNIVTEPKSKVAQTLADFRGNYLYNLQDGHMRRFNSRVAQVTLWDDHEVRDNWYPTRDLSKDERYQEKGMALIAARAQQAFVEYNPLPVHPDEAQRVYRSIPCGPLAEIFALDLRSYRGPNSENRQPTLTDESRVMGAAQVEWLKASLLGSRAVWKVIANDMPIGVVVRDMPLFYEAVANGENGIPLGREMEFAEILKFIRARRIRNVVWVTGDIHYCAAHHYDPARARFTEFDPFWEFVAGPLHAGTFGPSELDATFGPEEKFRGIPPGMKPNRPPSAGLQFFGKLTINAKTRALTASLHDLNGRYLYRTELAPTR
jgi:alkaline phosphatase D